MLLLEVQFGLWSWGLFELHPDLGLKMEWAQVELL